jgi:methyltransferase (TIGR00027 family)
VFEVDFPTTQTDKKAKMLAEFKNLPTNLNFVGVNFEREGLAEGLARSRYDPNQLTFFSWLGVTMYLTRESTLATLQSVTDNSPNGSQIVFDYIASATLKNVMKKTSSRRLSKLVARWGEPFIGFFAVNEMADMLASTGMELIENLSPKEQQSRYHSQRRDRTKTIARAYFAHAEVVANKSSG